METLPSLTTAATLVATSMLIRVDIRLDDWVDIRFIKTKK